MKVTLIIQSQIVLPHKTYKQTRSNYWLTWLWLIRCEIKVSIIQKEILGFGDIFMVCLLFGVFLLLFFCLFVFPEEKTTLFGRTWMDNWQCFLLPTMLLGIFRLFHSLVWHFRKKLKEGVYTHLLVWDRMTWVLRVWSNMLYLFHL